MHTYMILYNEHDLFIGHTPNWQLSFEWNPIGVAG